MEQTKIRTELFTLPPLPYRYNGLLPYIDEETMLLHHDKHHATYINNLNEAIVASPFTYAGKTIENILNMLSALPPGIRNNAGGHYNHSLFWHLLTPGGPDKPLPALAAAIRQQFQSFDAFKDLFSKVAAGRFGSGWAWLVAKEGKLSVFSTPNQDNPLMDIAEIQAQPVICLDVWEHAYYLKYQNRRADYINAFWKLVNWEVANEWWLHSS